MYYKLLGIALYLLGTIVYAIGAKIFKNEELSYDNLIANDPDFDVFPEYVCEITYKFILYIVLPILLLLWPIWTIFGAIKGFEPL